MRRLSSARLIARNTGVVIGGELISKVGSLAFYVVMARELGKRGLGDFVFALSVVLFIELAEFGTDVIVTREVARDRDELAPIYWNALLTKIAAGVAGALLALGIAVAGGYPAHVVRVVAILAVAKFVELASKNAQAALRGVEDMTPIAISLIVQRFSTAAVGIAAMLAGARVALVAVVYLGGVVASLAYLLRALERRGLRPRIELSRARLVAVLRMSLPYGLSAIAITLFGRIDATILSLMKGNTAVGIYGAAYRLFDGTLFLSWAFGLSLLPSFSRLDRTTAPSIGYAFEAASKVILTVLLPVGAGVALFARPIIVTAYGHAFTSAVPVARLLGGAITLYGLFFVASNVLLARDRQRAVIWMSATVAVTNIVLNLVLIPGYSARGAAAAMTFSQATLTVLALSAALRTTGRVSLVRIVAGPAAGGLAIVAVALVTGTGILGLALAAVAYPVALVVTEWWLFPADIRLLVGALFRRPVLAK